MDAGAVRDRQDRGDPSNAFKPEAVLATIEAELGTSLYGVPTMFIAELAHPDYGRFDLSSLRTGIMAGSLFPTEVMKQAWSACTWAR